MRALITGITGQDGSYLAEFLLEKGYEVYGIVRRSSLEKFDRIEAITEKIRFVEGDLTDQSSLDQALQQLKPDELPKEYRFVNTQTCTRLANGNTIICSRGNNGAGPQLVEVTPDKKVVWVLWDFTTLGPATAVQILDDPGIPENPGESEH